VIREIPEKGPRDLDWSSCKCGDAASFDIKGPSARKGEDREVVANASEDEIPA
jgi:hypothetical protein